MTQNLILVDSSVWIQCLREGNSLSREHFDRLLADDRVAICGPVKAEVLSGARTWDDFHKLSNWFEGLHILSIDYEKIWDIITDLRHAICDLQRAWWCGDQRNAHASKCLLRRQTTSQRDIVHHTGRYWRTATTARVPEAKESAQRVGNQGPLGFVGLCWTLHFKKIFKSGHHEHLTHSNLR